MSVDGTREADREPDYTWLGDGWVRWLAEHLSPATATLLPIGAFALFHAGQLAWQLVTARDVVMRVTSAILLGLYALMGWMAFLLLKLERMLLAQQRARRAAQDAERRHELHGRLADLLSAEVSRQRANPQDVEPQDG